MKIRESQPPSKAQKVQSVEVGTLILKALADLSPSTSLKHLSEYLQMPAAKVHRYLQALLASGFAEQDPLTSHYALGPEALHLGLVAIRRLEVARLAAPFLAALRDNLGQTCFLAVWGSHGATVVQVEAAPGLVTLVTQVGSVLPLQSSSTGRVFAAFHPALVGNSEVDPELLEAIRKTALHAVHGLLMPGVNALSAPVFRLGQELAGVMTVVGSAANFPADLHSAPAQQLAQVARQLSLRMGAE